MALLEILAVAGILILLAGFSKKLVKEAKFRKYAKYAGGFFVAIGLIFGGYAFAGVPALLTTAPGGAPAGASLWDAVWDTANSDTDRTETEVISVDQRTITYIMADVQMDGLGDVLMGAVLVNKNTDGDGDSRYAAVVALDFVGTVIVAGVATPVANYTTDRSRFNIAYSEDSGPGTWTQIFDRFESGDQTMGGTSALSLDLPVDPAVADDVAAGGTFELRYLVGGVSLKVVLQES